MVGAPVINLGPLLLVLAAVILNLASAVLLDYVAAYEKQEMLVIAVALVFVAGLNVLRFIVWGVAHKRYPISATYPLSTMFFPLILLVAYMQGEPVQLVKVLGTFLIVCGVVLVSFKQDVERGLK